MKKEVKSQTDRIVIPVAQQEPTESGEIPLSEADMNQLHGVKPIYRSLLCVFKDRLGQPVLVGGEIRIALKADSSLACYSTEQFITQIEVTASELQRNSNRDQPLPHSQALKHVALGKFLESVSAAQRKHGTTLQICCDGEDYECPTLEPGTFVQPDRPDELRMTGSFDITGVHRQWSGGPSGLYVGDNRLLVELPTDDPSWTWAKVRDVLEQPTYLVGSLVRATKSSAWRPDAGARLERQEVVPGFGPEVAG